MKEEKLKITFPDGNTIETAKNTVASELLKNINGQNSRVLAMRLNNKIYSLEKKIKYSGKIEPVFIDTKDGSNIYRRPQRPLFKQITFYVAQNCRFIHLKKSYASRSIENQTVSLPQCFYRILRYNRITSNDTKIIL